MHFDRFDICEAYWLIERDWNKSGWLQERRREAPHIQLSRLKFRPAPNLDYMTMSENGREIYDRLVVRYGI